MQEVPFWSIGMFTWIKKNILASQGRLSVHTTQSLWNQSVPSEQEYRPPTLASPGVFSENVPTVFLNFVRLSLGTLAIHTYHGNLRCGKILNICLHPRLCLFVSSDNQYITTVLILKSVLKFPSPPFSPWYYSAADVVLLVLQWLHSSFCFKGKQGPNHGRRKSWNTRNSLWYVSM